MQSGDVVKLYEIGLRGKPIRTIRAGDLAEPYGSSLWRRVTKIAKAIAEVAYEARALEERTLDHRYHLRGGGW